MKGKQMESKLFAGGLEGLGGGGVILLLVSSLITDGESRSMIMSITR